VKAQIKVPAVGESITEGTIAQWTKKDGEFVKRDDVVLVLETDKASVEVVAETDGVLSTKAKAGEVVKVGSIVGEVDIDAKGATPPAAKPEKTSDKPTPAKPQGPPATMSPGKPTQGIPSAEGLSPAVRRVVAEAALNTEGLTGTGRGGRLTKSDVMAAAGGAGQASNVAVL
jgi:2-oxoglutarate dehydrogenase E2 component (dihydrolipoamide succinyltransferase)